MEKSNKSNKSKKVTVRITKSLIKKGRRGNCSYCPIGLALRTLGFHRVSVYNTFLQFTTSRNSKKYLGANLPYEAETFVNRFDDGKAVEPFSFSFVPEGA